MKTPSGTLQILVIKLGWVLIGQVTETPDEFLIINTRCIRKWGTKAGLGELALQGPRKDSVLDFVGVARVNRGAVLFRIDCDPPKWEP